MAPQGTTGKASPYAPSEANLTFSPTTQKGLRKGTSTIKQVLPPEKEKRSTDDLFVLLFTRLALQGIVCLHL